jgi:gluconolactonase
MSDVYQVEALATIFAEGLDHPEGLAFDSKGDLWCGGEGGQIYKILSNGRHSEVANVGGFCLGVAFRPDGKLLICRVEPPGLVVLDPETCNHEVFATEVAGRRLITPNFPAFDRKGNLYFSDSGMKDSATGCVVKIRLDGVETIWQADLRFANGLSFDLEQRTLFVVQSFDDNVLRIPILADGSSGKPEIYCAQLEAVPDGLALDEEGNLYTSCYGNSRIYRIRPDGSKEIVSEDRQGIVLNRVTNLAFGGLDLKDLYAANLGGRQISSLKMDTPGVSLLNGG